MALLHTIDEYQYNELLNFWNNSNNSIIVYSDLFDVKKIVSALLTTLISTVNVTFSDVCYNPSVQKSLNTPGESGNDLTRRKRKLDDSSISTKSDVYNIDQLYNKLSKIASYSVGPLKLKGNNVTTPQTVDTSINFNKSSVEVLIISENVSEIDQFHKLYIANTPYRHKFLATTVFKAIEFLSNQQYNISLCVCFGHNVEKLSPALQFLLHITNKKVKLVLVVSASKLESTFSFVEKFSSLYKKDVSTYTLDFKRCKHYKTFADTVSEFSSVQITKLQESNPDFALNELLNNSINKVMSSYSSHEFQSTLTYLKSKLTRLNPLSFHFELLNLNLLKDHYNSNHKIFRTLELLSSARLFQANGYFMYLFQLLNQKSIYFYEKIANLSYLLELNKVEYSDKRTQKLLKEFKQRLSDNCSLVCESSDMTDKSVASLAQQLSIADVGQFHIILDVPSVFLLRKAYRLLIRLVDGGYISKEKSVNCDICIIETSSVNMEKLVKLESLALSNNLHHKYICYETDDTILMNAHSMNLSMKLHLLANRKDGILNTYFRLDTEKNSSGLRLDDGVEIIKFDMDKDWVRQLKNLFVVYVDSRESRCMLPLHLLKSNWQVRFSFFRAADYILSNDCAIERKEYNDLQHSLKNCHLFKQLKVMSYIFTSPILLIEFNESHKTIANSLFVRLKFTFPKLTVLCSLGHSHSVKLMSDIVQKNVFFDRKADGETTNIDLRQTENYLTVALDILLILNQNINEVINKYNNLYEYYKALDDD